MEWLERLNNTLDYIETHLKDEVDYNEAAKIACCSTFHFQRMFSYIAGMPLNEYIRRRRMTMAAFDLQNGEKVMDVALRYGYESPTSFNRAFQSIHGIAPSLARKEGILLKAYPKISFRISIKGDVEMDYKIIKKDVFRIIGYQIKMSKDIEKNFQEVPKFWEEVSKGDRLQKVIQSMNSEPMGVLGMSVCVGEEWSYYIASASTSPLQQDMAEYEVPSGTWAVFQGTGAMPTAIQELEKRAFTEWLPTSDFEYADAPDIEVYKKADPQNAEFEVWIPVRRKL